MMLLAGRYTLLEQGALESFLPLCAARGVRLVIGGPYNRGILAHGARGPGPFNYEYQPGSHEIVGRVAPIEEIGSASCREEEQPYGLRQTYVVTSNTITQYQPT